MNPVRPIPFTVLGGWLGSGKTTLVNRLLAETTERIAVIVNDVGEINIDAELIAEVGDQVVELTNGCVCCSIGSSLAVTLRDLSSGDPRPDRIVLEASGVADPARVARYGDRSVVPLDAVITVVDAGDVCDRVVDSTYGRLAGAQIAACDLAIVTKLDIVDASVGDAVFAMVRGICSGPVIAVDDTPGWTAAVVAGTVGRPVTAPAAAGETRRGVPNGGPVSDAPVTSAVWTFDGLVDPAEVVARLRRVDTLLRAKGFVDTPEGPMVVQAAGSRITTTPAKFAPGSLGRVVVLTNTPGIHS